MPVEARPIFRHRCGLSTNGSLRCRRARRGRLMAITRPRTSAGAIWRSSSRPPRRHCLAPPPPWRSGRPVRGRLFLDEHLPLIAEMLSSECAFRVNGKIFEDACAIRLTKEEGDHFWDGTLIPSFLARFDSSLRGQKQRAQAMRENPPTIRHGRRVQAFPFGVHC
jgi:hypothetical protein